MKSISLNLFIFVCILQQTVGWKALLDRVECIYANKAFINMNAQVSKYNRTTKALNIKFDLLKNLPNNGMMEIKLYGFMSNQYRELPFKISRTFCSFLNLEYQWIKNEIKGNFVKSCPIYNGSYSIDNFVLDVKRFPTKPWNIDNYMVPFKVYNKNEVFLILKFYTITTSNDEYAVSD